MPHYSFILVCYNNWEFTKQAIESLLSSFGCKYSNYGVELIIVSNGSKDQTNQELESFKESYKGCIEIVLVNIEENIGYSVGLNVGLSKARGQIITVLNNDLIFPKGWFDGLVEELNKDSSLGVVVPYLSYASGVQDVGVRFNSSQEIQDFADKFINEHRGLITYANRVISACLTMKREVLDLIGGYDFWFGLGMYDDDDWSLRVRVGGYRIGVVGSSFVHHIGNATFAKDHEGTSAAILSNCKKFMKKWNLKGIEYEDGVYVDREDAIKSITYMKQKQYFPIKYEDYELFNHDESIRNGEIKRYILVADWTNFKSEWGKKVEQFLENGSNEELCLWIPKQYFEQSEIMDKITKVVQHLENGENLIDSLVKIMYENVYPMQIMAVIKSFDGVLFVENDYVNKCIVNLAKQANIQVI